MPHANNQIDTTMHPAIKRISPIGTVLFDMRKIAVLLAVYCPLTAYAADGVGGLGVSSEAIIRAALESGYLSREDFDGTRPDLPSIAAFASHNEGDFTITAQGEPGDVRQIQIFISTLTNSVDKGLSTAGDIVHLVLPDHPAPHPNIAQQMPTASASTQWAGQNFIEAWEAWPGRGVRKEWRAGDKLLIFEGTPPDYFFLTIVASADDHSTTSGPSVLADAHEAMRKEDYETALSIIRPLAVDGNAEAQYELGEAYYFGRGTTRDYAEAVRWYRAAAEQGHVMAQLNLGKLFPKASGIEIGPEERLRWLGSAADQGNGDAFHELATWVFRDQRDRQEAERSFTWCSISAELGNGRGQLCLANRYWNGWGVRRDDAQAYLWATIAASELDPGFTAMNASYLRADYRKNLSEAQIAEADKTAAAWKPKPYADLKPLCEDKECAIWR